MFSKTSFISKLIKSNYPVYKQIANKYLSLKKITVQTSLDSCIRLTFYIPKQSKANHQSASKNDL